MRITDALRVVQAGCILLLLATYFAYVIAPVVRMASRRVRIGRRRRPLSRAAAIILIYVVLFAVGALVWRVTSPIVERWIRITAPAAIGRVFSDTDRAAAIDRLYAQLPVHDEVKRVAARTTGTLLAYIDDEVRQALDDVVEATRYVKWLLITPIITFVLLAYAPGFLRSALGTLPHGHLRWRGDEYLRDVNSALAGYVRAQLAAGTLMAVVCTTLFSLFQLPYPVSMGIVAGVLELLPVLGPLTVVVMAAGQAPEHAVALVIALCGVRVVQDVLVYPRLIGRGMHLSSIAVILAVWCGAAINGAAGVVLAIPFAGFLSVSLRHWREYQAIERLVRSAARGSRL